MLQACTTGSTTFEGWQWIVDSRGRSDDAELRCLAGMEDAPPAGSLRLDEWNVFLLFVPVGVRGWCHEAEGHGKGN